jgi:PTH1 family peptidyl-tRNA hydrolase
MEPVGIRLIVGLGNPGSDYAPTRHNVGFWFVDALALDQGQGQGQAGFKAESRFHGELGRLSRRGRDLRLLKPSTYMNHSGRAVAAVCRYFEISPEQVLVAHDELDLPVGTVRLKQGGGHAGHNGLRDTINLLGTRDFWRLRIGIDHPGDRSLVTNYVLGRPSRDDAIRIEEALRDAEAIVDDCLDGRFQMAMNRLHRSR